MIDRDPVWRFSSDRQLTQWYGHVQLLPSCAIGQWFCVDRQSGDLKWQRQHFRASSICGFDSGVIVAYEMRSDGPWTAGFGCYGLSLESGELVWSSHAGQTHTKVFVGQVVASSSCHSILPFDVAWRYFLCLHSV